MNAYGAFTGSLASRARISLGSGEQAIRRDVLVKRHSLSDRQGKALEYIQEHGSLTIQDFERLCPEVNRRTLQRDLKLLGEKELLKSEGATNQLIYRLKGKRR